MGKFVTLRRFHFILIIAIALLAGYFLGTRKISAEWSGYKPILSIESKSPPPGQNVDFSLLYEVLDKVSQDYYDKSKIDSQKLLYGAINGMLGSLEDPYTSFFPPKENSQFKDQLAGEFQGIGAELTLTEDNRISVVAPLEGSPAQRAGVRAGDVILQVDGEDTAGWTLPQAVENIRGEKGSKVTLQILHDGENEVVDIVITRDVIQIDSVKGWVKSLRCTGDECTVVENCPTCEKIAYIRLSQFGDRTNDEWVKVVNSLYPQIQNEDVAGLILDVRNNPGGYLHDAVFIASEFVDDGVVVMQEDKNGERMEMSVERNGVLLDIPIIVLINRGSASASEIVAGALRDHGRARLVGEKSFGKGTIQSAVDIENGASIHVSVAKWLTPKGTWVHKEGLTPDITVEFDATASADTSIEGPEFDNQLARAILELMD